MTGPMSVFPHPSNVTEEDLERAGFSRDEIKRLRDIREAYPFIEFVDSRREWHRLRFVRWLYKQGQITR